MLTALRPNGTVKWQFDMGSDSSIVYNAASLGDNATLFVGVTEDSSAGQILAVQDRRTSAALVWSFLASGSGQFRGSPVVGLRSGTVIALTDDGAVYALSAANGRYV